MSAMRQDEFVTDLQSKAYQHCQIVEKLFQPLDDDRLQWQENEKEWSVLQCFEHLNLTYDYYIQKVEKARGQMPANASSSSLYTPSFWGRIYMYFALNPSYRFSAPDAIVPDQTDLTRTVLATYLQKQKELQTLLTSAVTTNLTKTKVPLEKWVKFNLGDCLKIIVYHDDLHIRQAQKVLSAYRASHL